MTFWMFKRALIGLAIGGVLGFLWHKLVGCRTGACPLIATPLRSVLYGGFLGLLGSLVSKPNP